MQAGDRAGQILGHYKIKREIGYGGMATVFLADDIHLGREVALKVFWPQPGETQDFLRRFTREARVLAQLDHPNILPVYDYGRQDGVAFLVVPYLAGGTLKEALQKRKALPPSEAIKLICQVLPALQYAHDRNLIHRDIKPGNLLFKSDGSLVLADFGLVKVLEGDDREGIPLHTLSESGQSLAGTPEYMSPEQINGHAVAASDIYSLGVVLYEMVTGVRPFVGNTLLSVLVKHANEAPRPPHELNPYVSPQLEAAILKALAKDPGQRFARPVDFQRAIQQIGNPGSNPGIAPGSNPGVAGLPMQPNTPINPTRPPMGSEGTVAANWPSAQAPQARGPEPPNAPVRLNNQQLQTYGPGSPGAPTVANTWQAAQGPLSQAGLPPSGKPAAPLPSPQPVAQPPQAWTPLQTVAPSPAPQLPRRRRTPLLVALVCCLLLAGVAASLFLTPLGLTILRRLSPSLSTPTPITHTTPTASPTSSPGGTQPVPPTATNCPANNGARAEVTAPLALGSDPTLVYIIDQSDASGNPTNGIIESLDTVSSQKTQLVKIGQADITEAQISVDGQWVLFSAIVAGRSELRLLRLDGEGLQTLLCAPTGMTIRYSQWSLGQNYVVFDEFPQNGEPTVYLLTMKTGALQVEVTPPASGVALAARTWLDDSRVLMIGVTPNSDAPPQNVYLLNIANGTKQSMQNIAPVFTSTGACWDFDSSGDSKSLFITQCTPGTPTGSSTIGEQSVNGGTLTTVMTSASQAFGVVRVIDASSTTLMAIASNAGQGNVGQDGLYVVTTDGSNNSRLLMNTPASAVISLNAFSQYFWSNFSRQNTGLYALETVKTSGNSPDYSLEYGQINGGTPNVFASDTQYMAVVGWSTT